MYMFGQNYKKHQINAVFVVNVVLYYIYIYMSQEILN